jgi:UDP:flavonoid glycosyltransferase YjiC (YdhE family)
MKFILSSFGTRGEIEPCAAIGRELLNRGHEVRMAVTSDLVGFVESVGLPAFAYQVDSRSLIRFHLELWEKFYFTRNHFRIRDLRKVRAESMQVYLQADAETRTALMSLANGADLLLTGWCYEQPAATVAERHGIPFATIHYSPVRGNGAILPALPAPVVRSAKAVSEWLRWRQGKKAEDALRFELGLPKTDAPYMNRMAERGSLEIQAYDQICYPGLAAEWAKWGLQRPFVGSLTMELPTNTDDEALSWIAEGAPPICFSFGSMPVKSSADTIAMISAACARLGERALIISGEAGLRGIPYPDHLKVVPAANYAAVFPRCRAVVHHGSTGATGASLRAGVPVLILWFIGDQAVLGESVKRLKVGTARRFSATTLESLVADLRTILAPQYAIRAREIVPRIIEPAEGVAAAADLVESLAGRCAADPAGRSSRP